jgi:hypothetical protein
VVSNGESKLRNKHENEITGEYLTYRLCGHILFCVNRQSTVFDFKKNFSTPYEFSSGHGLAVRLRRIPSPPVMWRRWRRAAGTPESSRAKTYQSFQFEVVEYDEEGNGPAGRSGMNPISQ